MTEIARVLFPFSVEPRESTYEDHVRGADWPIGITCALRLGSQSCGPIRFGLVIRIEIPNVTGRISVSVCGSRGVGINLTMLPITSS